MNELVKFEKSFDAEELKGITLTLPMLKMPSGGSTFFTKKIGDVETPIDSITGVIIDHFRTRIRFEPEEDGEVSNNPPLCVSKGGEFGIGDPGMKCEECEYSKYKKDEKRQCVERREIYIMETGARLPILLNIPGGSLYAFSQFITWLVTQGYSSTKEVFVKITLRKETNKKNGKPFASCVFQWDRDCTNDEAKQYMDLANTYRPMIRKVEDISEVVELPSQSDLVTTKQMQEVVIFCKDCGIDEDTRHRLGEKLWNIGTFKELTVKMYSDFWELVEDRTECIMGMKPTDEQKKSFVELVKGIVNA